MRTLKAVFFDFGGTLFSYRSFGEGAGDLVERLADRLGYTGPDRNMLGLIYHRCSSEAFKRYAKKPYYLHRDVFREAYLDFGAKLEMPVDDDFLDFALAETRAWMVNSFNLREDCRSVLEALSARGLYLSIVSNIDDDYLGPMVARSGLEDVLDDWSSSEEARSCKPDPGFFEFALAKAGCRADEVLFVGDSPEHDIAGAKPLGMQTALMSEPGLEPPGTVGDVDPALTTADHIITDLTALLDLTEHHTRG
jgi:putative hydrolase of the HAD superfamily